MRSGRRFTAPTARQNPVSLSPARRSAASRRSVSARIASISRSSTNTSVGEVRPNSSSAACATARRLGLVELQQLVRLSVAISARLTDAPPEVAHEVVEAVADLRGVRAECLQLQLERGRDVDDRVGALVERREEKRSRLVRLEPLLRPQLGEHLPRG